MIFGKDNGRPVTFGGAGKTFKVSAMDLLFKEQQILGSRYVTHIEVIESLELVARGEIWPLVSEIRPMEGGRRIACVGGKRKSHGPRRVRHFLSLRHTRRKPTVTSGQFMATVRKLRRENVRKF